MSDKLTLSDIADFRAYERERDAFRAHIIDLKKRRRVALGPFITLLFENRDTIRFQIQEMARAERLFSDEQIETELAIYNPLVPGPGELAATLFIELTSKDQLMEWLPKLVGIERSIELVAGDLHMPARPDAAHEQQLTREHITASVHYVHWDLEPAAVEVLRTGGPIRLASTHDEYHHEVELSPETIAELAADAI